jgi:16S rRNA (guanine527-N7)-methyltransferase
LENLEQIVRRVFPKISEQQLKQFTIYLEILLTKGEKVTSIKDPKEIVKKHFIDSLSCSKGVKFTKGMRVIDIGSGGGFPGFPLKIIYPWIELALLECNKKKIAFLLEVRRKLGIDGVKILGGRAEELAHVDGFRECFDVAVARGVASLNVLLELALPFLKVGGKLVAPKGANAGEEIREANKALEIMGGKLTEIIPLERGRLVIVEKVALTPKKYPRRPGIPKKHPL